MDPRAPETVAQTPPPQPAGARCTCRARPAGPVRPPPRGACPHNRGSCPAPWFLHRRNSDAAFVLDGDARRPLRRRLGDPVVEDGPIGRIQIRAQATLSLTVGVNRTSLGTNADGASRAPGFESPTRRSVGLAASTPVTDRFGLQLGGRYAQRGGRLDVLEVMAMMGDMFGGFEEMPPGLIPGRSMSALPGAPESTSG